MEEIEILQEIKVSRKLFPAKIICIGDCSVGKTSIICRFIKDSFKLLNHSTLGFLHIFLKNPLRNFAKNSQKSGFSLNFFLKVWSISRRFYR